MAQSAASCFFLSVHSDDHVSCCDVCIQNVTKELHVTLVKYLTSRRNSKGHPGEGISGEQSIEGAQVTACLYGGVSSSTNPFGLVQ